MGWYKSSQPLEKEKDLWNQLNVEFMIWLFGSIKPGSKENGRYIAAIFMMTFITFTPWQKIYFIIEVIGNILKYTVTIKVRIFKKIIVYLKMHRLKKQSEKV